MANECIPLALSKRNLAKLNFPVLASIKIDGVPVRLTVKVDIVGNVTSWEVVSRQGKPVESCSQLMLEFMQSARSIFEGVPGTHKIVGEIHSRENTFEDFKTVSGIVRRKYDQSHLLAWAIFDYYWDGTDEPYGERMKFIDQRLAACITPDSGVYVVPQITYFDEESLLQWFRRTTQAYPSMEGGIAMSYSAEYKEGLRNTQYQKLLNEPTIDLSIVSVEEAIDKHGNPKGMVGRLNASYKGKVIGIGPGKMSHEERTTMWNEFVSYASGSIRERFRVGSSKIAVIKYKPDSSYDALRQPTFQRWHEDKLTPDA